MVAVSIAHPNDPKRNVYLSSPLPAEIPPRVEYCLTEKGLALVDIIEATKQFGERYLADSEPTPPSPTIDIPLL